MKKMKRILSTLFAAFCGVTLAVGTVACGDKKNSTPVTVYEVYDSRQELVFDNNNKTLEVEFGTVYSVPMNFFVDYQEAADLTVTLKNPDGEEERLMYGSFSFNKVVGTYTIDYTYGVYVNEVYEQKTFTVDVLCKDTVAPVVRIVSYEYYGVIGDEISLPTAEVTDVAGIGSLVYSVKSPSGVEKVITGDTFTLEEVGNHVVTLTATDKNGVAGSSSITVQSMNTWVDEDLKTGEIYSFNNETYTDLVLNMASNYTSAEYSIVTEGYPTIENEPDGNGVLQIKGADTWGNVNSLFFLHEDILASTGYEIVVKFAVSDYVDYFKLFKTAEELIDKNLVDYEWEIYPGKWYELRINPIAYGYGMNFKDFVIQYRNRGNVTVWIDSITFTEPEFVDEDWSETNYGDFDEEGYLHHVYQNVYNEPTTTRAFRVGGTKFSILSADDKDVPAANGSSTYAPGLAPSGGVLKGVTGDAWGGMTYMFPEAFDLDKGLYIRMRVYLTQTNCLVFGALDGLGNDSTNTAWLSVGTLNWHTNQWSDIILPADALRKFSADGKISGVFFQFQALGGVNATHEMPFYVDEIEAVYKVEGESEQTGVNIATFENGNLCNVANNDKKVASTFEIAEDVFGATGNSLKITSTASQSGFIYFLDEPIASGDELKKTALTFKVAIPEESKGKVTSVAINAITSLGGRTALGTFAIPETISNDWVQFVINGRDLVELLLAKSVGALEFAFSTSGEQTFYFDDLGFVDYSNDTEAPTTTTEAFTLFTHDALAIDLTALSVEVSDNMDFAPTWEIVGLFDGSNNDITVEIDEDGKFQPTASGAYTLAIVLSDAIGNQSETINITLNIEVVAKDAYYQKAFAFDNDSALSILDNGAKSIVADEKAEDGKAAAVTMYNNNSGEDLVAIDLGATYKVGEVSSITVRMRTAAGGTQATWWRTMINGYEWYHVYNDDGSVKSYYQALAANIVGGGANPTRGQAVDVKEDYMTVTLTQASMLAYLTAIGVETGKDTVLSTVNFWTQWQNNSKDAHFTTFYIDSVTIVEYVPAKFNVLKEGTTNEYILMDTTALGVTDYLSNKNSSFNVADGKMTYVPTANWANGYTQYTLPEAINVSDIGVIKVVAKSPKPVLIYFVDETGATAYTCLWRNYDDASDHIGYSETIDEAGRTTYTISLPSSGIPGNKIVALRFGTNTSNSSNEIYEVTYFKTTAACNALISGSTTQYNLVDYTKEAEQATAFATSRKYREGFTSAYSSAGLTVTTGQYGNCYACFFTPIRVKISEIDTYTFVVSSNANTFRLMAGVQTGSVEFTADSEGVTVTDNGDGTKTVTVDVSTLTFVTFASGAWTTTAGTATYITGVEIYGGAAKEYTVKSISYTKATA